MGTLYCKNGIIFCYNSQLLVAVHYIALESFEINPQHITCYSSDVAVTLVVLSKVLTSRRSMVPSRQSSWLTLGVLACNKAAMRRVVWSRALPKGSSRTPIVVKIDSFCNTNYRTANAIIMIGLALQW